MASVEQPLKKRKLYEASPPPPPPSQPPAPPPPPPLRPTDEFIPPPPQTPPPLSPEEVVVRRRNQEEIRNVLENYKTIKRCISSGKDPRQLPELEQAYLSLISASRGCTSVQRILSEFIPRYSPCCPTALEAAAQVVINMHNWNVPLISRGEDIDGVSFATAKNCIAGLVDICFTASREAPSSSVIQGICSVVFLNAATFFASSLEGKNIFQIIDRECLNIQDSALMFAHFKQRVVEENISPLLKLLKLRALCLLRIFFLCPENLIAACFELFSNRDHTTDGFCREGKYYLSQLCGTLLNPNGESPMIFGEAVEPETCTGYMRLEVDDVNYEKISSDLGYIHKNKKKVLKCCLLGLALHREPSLKKLVLSNYRRLQNSASSAVVAEVTSAFQEIFESISEREEDTRDSDDGIDSSRNVNRHGISNQHRMFGDSLTTDHSSQFLGKPFKDDLANKTSGSYLKRHSSDDNDRHSNTSLNHDSGAHKSMDFDTRENGDRCHNWLPLPNDHLNDQLFSPVSRHLSQSKTDPFEQRDQEVQLDKNKVSGNNFAVYHPARSSQIIWYSDGDPAAMDVFSASRQLWLGSLAPDTTEAALRFELERVGLIENFVFFPVKGFALVDYRSIIDAVNAREFLRRFSPWGHPIRTRFIDVGLGTRGAVNGIAIGSSCHVFVGNVLNQWMKDEITGEIMKLCRGPRLVTELASEGALLLEFETPEDAGNAMACIRQFRRGNNSCNSAIAGQADSSRSCLSIWNSGPAPGSSSMGNICNSFLGSPHGQTAGSPSSRMHNVSFTMKSDGFPSEFVSPRATFEQGSLLKGQTLQSNLSPSVCIDTTGSVPGTTTQMWYHKQPELEIQSTGDNTVGATIATHVPTIAPQQLIVASPYVQHVYPAPSSSWDAHGFNHHLPFNVHSNITPSIVQASGTPLSQMAVSGIHQYSHILPPEPVVSNPLLSVPPSQLHLPPPLPPPPTVPPPPSSPPPPPPPPSMDPPTSTSEPSGSAPAEASLRIQWKGTLSKSGVHFCSIYAHRLDADFCKYSISVPEPTGWPVKLDMTKRTDFRHVKDAFTGTASHRREVCQLLPSSAADKKGDFVSYLKQRDCAGVIKIPSVGSLWARLLFILPYSPEACMMLSVKPTSSDCLIGVVLPRESNMDCP